jgi:hypothetical protein
MMQEYPRPGGVYKHYKGGLYRVLFLSKHSETEEILVNYQSLHFGSYYSRPLDSWNLKVNKKPRFEEIEDDFDQP